MKDGIIIYKSKYGSTEKYAKWLSEITSFECIDVKAAKKVTIDDYGVIILAGAIYASGIAGLSFIKSNISRIDKSKVAAFCVGASPYDEKAYNEIYAHNFKDNLNGIDCFYGRGAWDEDAMTFKDRTLCRLLQKAVAKQDPETYEPWQKALMCAVGQKCDWTDKEYLAPLIEWINKNRKDSI